MRSTARSQGIVLVMVSAALTALMGFAAIGVDLAYLMGAQGELSAAADATALAGASGLNVSLDETVRQEAARDRASFYASRNTVLGESLNLNAQHTPIEFGRWDTDARLFQPGAVPTNALRVSLELTESTTPPAPPLFFAPVLGQATGRVAATATAALVGSRDMVLALDRSESMCEDTCGSACRPDCAPHQPLTDTKESAKDFVDLLDPESDQVGLVSYSGSALKNNPLTNDVASVKSEIDGLNADGCTNIAAALCMARDEVTSERASKNAIPVVVLLSDGKPNTRLDPSSPSPCEAGPSCQDLGEEQNPNNQSARDALTQADLIAQADIILYTISLGNDTNEALMREMAENAGGKYFKAATTADLEAVFLEISAKIPVALVE